MQSFSEGNFPQIPQISFSLSDSLKGKQGRFRQNLLGKRVDYSTTVFDAASLFFKTKKRRFPVMNKDKLVGQLSRKDIVIAALNMKSQTWR